MPSPVAGTQLQGDGLSCSATGHSHDQGPAGVALGVLLLAAALRRRSTAVLAFTVTYTFWGLCAAPARADFAVDTILFRPTGMPYGGLNVEGAATQRSGSVSAGAYFWYVGSPLVLVNSATGVDTRARTGVLSQAVMQLHASVGLFGFLSLGFDMPVVLRQDLGAQGLQLALRGGSPRNEATAAMGPTNAGVGDMRLSLKVRLRASRRRLGVALMPLFTIPTGDANSYLGWGKVSVEGRLILDYRFRSGLLLLANGSFFTHQQTQAENLTLSHELRYGAGAMWPLMPSIELLAEIFGRVGLTGPDGSAAVTAQNSPAEGVIGVRYAHRIGIHFNLGAGMGLGHGYGAPNAQVFLGVGYGPPLRAQAPPPVVPAADEAQQPSGPPPPVLNQAPAPPTPQAVLPLPAQQRRPVLPQGLDRDRDGVENDLDRCPDLPGSIDNLGCPDRDLDGDGIVDRLDRCPGLPGPPDTQGCPSTRLARQGAPEGRPVVVPAMVRGWLIETAEPISFAPAQALLSERAEVMLQAVARLLAARPDLRRLRIEAHVNDVVLSPEQALALSQERGQVVQARLVKLGVAPARLLVQGFGSSRPVDQRPLHEARERNNRIEIVVADR